MVPLPSSNPKCSELWLTEDFYCSSPSWPCQCKFSWLNREEKVTFESSNQQLIFPTSSKCPIHSSPFCSGHSYRYIGALGARVICDNIPGLVNKQRQLCQRHPDIMQAIGEGTKEWIRECQHQFRHHRWNCSTLDRDHTVFGRVLLRSKSVYKHTFPSDSWLCGRMMLINLTPRLPVLSSLFFLFHFPSCAAMLHV